MLTKRRIEILAFMVENPDTKLTITWPEGGASYYQASWNGLRVSVNDLDAMESFLHIVYPRRGDEYYVINPDVRKLFNHILEKI